MVVSFVKDSFETSAGRGERGADVRRAERMLKDLGMKPGKVDGLYDKATANAVRAFQKKNGLAETGIADVKTRRAIQSAVDKLPTPSRSSSRATTRTSPRTTTRGSG